MTEDNKVVVGSIVWQVLTVPDAEGLKDFYAEVTGWAPRACSLGEYDDYEMCLPETNECVAGVCHARGTNANLPPVWLIYIQVKDVEESAKRCLELGGEVVDGPKALGSQKICVIRDPSGAVSAIVGN
ncbi:MAG: VOC family protein [Gemmataceae bacterium]